MVEPAATARPGWPSGTRSRCRPRAPARSPEVQRFGHRRHRCRAARWSGRSRSPAVVAFGVRLRFLGTKKRRGTRPNAASTRGSGSLLDQSRTSGGPLSTAGEVPLHACPTYLSWGKCEGRCDFPRVAHVQGPAGPVDDVHSSAASSAPPARSGRVMRSARRWRPPWGSRKGVGGPSTSHDSSARNSSPAPTDNQTARSPGRPSSQGQAPQDAQPEGLHIEALGAERSFTWMAR